MKSSQRILKTRTGFRAPAAVLAAVLVLSACGGGPTDSFSYDNAGLSVSARNHLEDFMTTVQLRSFKTRSIDWNRLHAEVMDIAKGAQHTEELNLAIQHVFTVIDDRHSRYVSRLGTQVRFPPTGCSVPVPNTPIVPAGVGYVRVRAFSGSGAAAAGFADALQDSLRVYDKVGIAGWIVDLRSNTGGNMWPMVAGIGPLLGASRVGFFRDADGNTQPWDYVNGSVLSNGTEIHRATSPYVVRDPNARVAVLINKSTASSGEAVAVAFRNRPNTRFFGTESCGLASAIQGMKLKDNSDLFLAVSLMADRTGVTYPATIVPDEPSATGDDVVPRAVAWLTQGNIQSELNSVGAIIKEVNPVN